MPGKCPRCGSRILKRTSKNGYTYYACEKLKDCGFMSWDVPTKDDCPECGKTMFKKSGRGFKKPFCINAECPNFLPEDQRGYRKKPAAAADDSKADADDSKAAKTTKNKKTTAKKSAKKTTTKKAPSKKAPANKKQSVGKTAKKTETTDQ